MARMLPPFTDPSIKSRAEQRVFNMRHEDPATRDWVCLHSLGLATHVRQRYGEIDFVVIVPGEGVYCLEIKGGRVHCVEGEWEFQDRFGNISKRQKSPFIQARDGMFSLQKAVSNHFGREHRIAQLVFGFGVMFPDIDWLHDDPEHEPWQVYDRSFRRPVSAFVTHLARHTRAQHPSKQTPSSGDIKELIGFLRPDFDYVVKPSDQIEQTEQELLRLTEEQYVLLDMLQGNDRLVVDGAAGTGKSMIAIEYARRQSGNGNKTLLLCYNKLLGQWLSSSVDRYKDGPAPVVDSFHHFLEKDIILRSSCSAQFLSKRESTRQSGSQGEFFLVDYPLFALDALTEIGLPLFDVIVIDEGQDLIRQEYLDVFDSLLKGGLAGGRWAVFADFARQAIFSKGTSEVEMRAQLSNRATHARFQLSINCRNTRSIGEETSVMSGFSSLPFRLSEVEGPAVEYQFFRSKKSEKTNLVSLLTKLLNSGVSADQIVILAPVLRERSCLEEMTPDDLTCKCEIVDFESSSQEKYSGRPIRFSTIQAFKGLESPIVILVDINRLNDEAARQLLYVGMSRARHRLYVFLDDSTHADYNRAVREKFKAGIS